MEFTLASVIGDDQEKGLNFYIEAVGCVRKRDIPMEKSRWLTVVPPEAPESGELVVEPNANPAAKAFQSALFERGIPLSAFEVAEVRREHERMGKAGVAFQTVPTPAGATTIAVLEDPCENLIQLFEA